MGLKTISSRNTVPCRAAFVPCTVGAGSTGESRPRAVGRMPSFPCVPDPDMREKPFRAVRSVLFVTGTVGLEGVGDAFPEFLEELFAPFAYLAGDLAHGLDFTLHHLSYAS